MWFLSNAKVSQLNNYLNRSGTVFRAPTAALECQEMGDYCFDPQFGLYKKDDINAEVETSKITEDKAPKIPSQSSIDQGFINCDSKNYFDIFCGKGNKPKVAKTKLDLWIDTSSSMKEFDFTEKDGSCYRKRLLKKLDGVCGFNQKVNVMMFDTSIKQAGGIESVCNNQGLNDYKRLMDWIERSDARKLVVITDTYELHKEFSDYIASKNGKLRGDREPLTAEDMLALADTLAKSCK